MPVKLLCVGMAPPSWLLAPLLLGASAVGVLPCNTGCPVGQNEVIKGKVAYCQRLLQLLGASAEMVRLSPLLDQPPQGNGKRLPVENLFNHTAIASGLMQFAQAYSAPSHFAFAHPYSPLGVVKVREDVCTGCSMCAMSCPTGALSFEKQEDSISLSFHAALCIACGQCLSKCPEQGAINLDKRTDLKQISQGKTVIYREETARCVACGAPIAPHKMLKRIETLLGSEFTATMPILSRYCLDCRSASAFSGLGKR
jgi:ferredoxin